MKIYPDPELPDVQVEWYEGDCAGDVANIDIVMTGIDDPSERYTATLACTAMKTEFADVTRQRFHVTGVLKDAMGADAGTTETDVDLRNGFDETAFLYFGIAFTNFRIAWTFDMGASCESLGADGVDVMFEQNGQFAFIHGGWCDLNMLTGNAFGGPFTV